MTDQTDAREKYRGQVKLLGKKAFTLRKMMEYGFWPKDLPTPQERQRDETPEDYEKRQALGAAYDAIAAALDQLYQERREITEKLTELGKRYGETWDTEKIRQAVMQELFRESKERRAARKQEAKQKKQAKSAAWQAKKAAQIVFIGKGYSGALDHRETDRHKLEEWGLPCIQDDLDLAAFLEMEPKTLRFLCYHREVTRTDHYHRYQIPKRSGGMRRIAAPKPQMKAAQRKILRGILEKLPAHPQAHGFLKGRSICTGAKVHRGAAEDAGALQKGEDSPGAHPDSAFQGPALVVNLDVADFFPSISFVRVRGLFRSFGYSGYVSSLLAMLCTDCDRVALSVKGELRYVRAGERVLPQGSPASPMISNLLCRAMDRRIVRGGERWGYQYSRYADDISLSFREMPEKPGKAVGYVARIVENEGFQVHPGKTRYLRENNRQAITGLVINDGGLGMPRDWVRSLRAAIHNGIRAQKQGKLNPALRRQILGKVAWLHAVNPQRYRRLIQTAEPLMESSPEPKDRETVSPVP